jgi:hypothetical protein
MRTSIIAILIAVPLVIRPAVAQQAAPSQNMQTEADKGIKTQNSGASGFVGEQDKPGNAAHMPGEANRNGNAESAASAPSAQNSGGITGAPGNKNGPPPGQGTVGSSNKSVQEQDPAGIKGLPGNKSGPPAKR